MAINIEEIVVRAFEQAFAQALERTLQTKAKALFKKAFKDGSPLAKELEAKIEEGFHYFIEEEIRRKKKKAGFKK